jgi:hypothetical protein
MVTGGGSFLEISRFHVTEIILWYGLPFRVNIHVKEFGGIHPKDF